MRIHTASAFDFFRKGVLCFATVVSLPAFGSGTVTNCTEANLRAALAGGGTVMFACSGSLALSNTLAITISTLILGNGNNVILDGGNVVQLFLVNGANVSLEIHDLILANGSSIGTPGVDSNSPTPGGPAFGGGILNQGGAVTLIGCTLTNLAAVGGNGGYGGQVPTSGGSGFGGAICNFGGIINLTNCTFSGNQAKGGIGSTGLFDSGDQGGQARGGAIYSDSGVVGISYVQFSGNLVSGGGWWGGVGGDAAGGAVFIRNSRLFLTGSSLIGNGVLGGGCLDPFSALSGGSSGNGLGGSLYLSADSTAIFQHCSFITNRANGADSGPAWVSAGIGQGGAIYNLGSAQIVNSLFCSNSCLGGRGGGFPLGQGGAIFSTNVLWIDSCTLSGNRAVGGSGSEYHNWVFRGGTGDGGAVWSSGDLRATNSTFVANSAAGATDYGLLSPGPGANGGAVRLAGGAGILMNVTVSGNRADAKADFPVGGPGYGGGLSCANATVTIRNCIIANSANGGDTWGALTDGGYNICSDSSANFSAMGSLNNVNPLLGPLTDNGGPTPTMLLSNGSPALDAIPTGFPPVDQRGVTRPQGVAADIGAVEDSQSQRVSSQIVFNPSRMEVGIVIQATAGSSYRLLASPDLVNWTTVARIVSLSTNSSSGPVQFTQPILPVSQQFFEVESP